MPDRWRQQVSGGRKYHWLCFVLGELVLPLGLPGILDDPCVAPQLPGAQAGREGAAAVRSAGRRGVRCSGSSVVWRDAVLGGAAEVANVVSCNIFQGDRGSNYDLWRVFSEAAGGGGGEDGERVGHGGDQLCLWGGG